MLMAGLDGIENKINPGNRLRRTCTIGGKEAAKLDHAWQP
jgi:glutamine synthetase